MLLPSRFLSLALVLVPASMAATNLKTPRRHAGSPLYPLFSETVQLGTKNFGLPRRATMDGSLCGRGFCTGISLRRGKRNVGFNPSWTDGNRRPDTCIDLPCRYASDPEGTHEPPVRSPTIEPCHSHCIPVAFISRSPAIFPIGSLSALPRSGEGGARDLLVNAKLVDAFDPSLFVDIDTAQDLELLQARCSSTGYDPVTGLFPLVSVL